MSLGTNVGLESVDYSAHFVYFQSSSLLIFVVSKIYFLKIDLRIQRGKTIYI